MVWKKNTQRYKESAEQKCRQLLKEIDALNASEDAAYGHKDLEECGSAPVSMEAIAAQVSELNDQIQNESMTRFGFDH